MSPGFGPVIKPEDPGDDILKASGDPNRPLPEPVNTAGVAVVLKVDAKCFIQPCRGPGQSYRTASEIVSKDMKLLGFCEILYRLNIGRVGAEFVRELLGGEVNMVARTGGLLDVFL
jgi:hypothetical protein